MLRRRDFLAAISAWAFTAPVTVHAFTEDDGTIALKRNGDEWTGSGVAVRLDKDGSVRVNAPGKRLLRVRLYWPGSMGSRFRYMGDAWERTYGDLAWRALEPERPYPWYVLATDGNTTIARGVKTNPGAFCFWLTDASGVTLWLDVRNGGSGVELGKRQLPAATIVTETYEKISPFEAACRFCKKMSTGALALPEPLYGGNNWYYAYGNSSADAIRADTERIAAYSPSGGNRAFMVIDDGWTDHRTTGPWDHGNPKFPDMAALAAEMSRMSVRPGLWFRPLTTEAKVPQSWMLRKGALDPTVPDVAEQIRKDVRTMCAWGYKLLKHDFSTYDLLGRWGFQMGAELTDSKWHFADRSRTNAEIVRGLYALLREAAGRTPLLGCNTVGHLAVGLFEVQRTGDDTSGRDWSRTRKMGVNTLAFRAPQQGSFFDVDADCVGLTTQIPWSLNRQWLDLLARSGTPLFVSAAPDAVGPEQKKTIMEAFARASQPQPVGEPLDWMETAEPGRWRFGKQTAKYDWYTDSPSMPL